jgi:predicted transcriptional regulator
MSGKKGGGATMLSSKIRQENEDKIANALEEASPLSVVQLFEITGICLSTVKITIDRMRDAALVRKHPVKMRQGKRGMLTSVYELGMDDEPKLKRDPVILTIHRHAQDVALFGEYQKVSA